MLVTSANDAGWGYLLNQQHKTALTIICVDEVPWFRRTTKSGPAVGIYQLGEQQADDAEGVVVGSEEMGGIEQGLSSRIGLDID